MACIINASTSNGLVNSADGSGQLKVQSNGVTTNALAWVNFNGTGTVAIRSSYNVSSITDNGTGDYTVNFATALSDANYSANVNAQRLNDKNTRGNLGSQTTYAGNKTTSILRVISTDSGFSSVDADMIDVNVFGN